MSDNYLDGNVLRDENGETIGFWLKPCANIRGVPCGDTETSDDHFNRCSPLVLWDEQNPPVGYAVPNEGRCVELKPDTITIWGREFKDVPSLDWLADAVKEKMGREKQEG